jgi:hypothetical protein
MRLEEHGAMAAEVVVGCLLWRRAGEWSRLRVGGRGRVGSDRIGSQGFPSPSEACGLPLAATAAPCAC